MFTCVISTICQLSTRVTHERLTRICFIDYDREMVIVAESAQGEIVAVGRLTREHSSAEAEFALLVSDAWHEHSLGTELLRKLVSLGSERRNSSGVWRYSR